MSILVDIAQWPVVQTVWDGETTVADVEKYIVQLDDIFGRKEPFLTITWMKKYSTSSEVRKKISELMNRHSEGAKKYSVCSALIAPSTAFRFVLSTVFLIKKMDTPYQVCANFDEALKFARTEAGKRNLRLPFKVMPILAAL